MKIKTDESHKSFDVTKVSKKAFKAIAQKIGIFAVTIGLVATFSGCSSANKTIMDGYRKDNEAIIQMYNDGKLQSQRFDSLNLYYAPVDENFIDSLPDIKILSLMNDMYIRDLSNLPQVCPSLEELYIDGCYGISNFDFIKKLPNLKVFKISGETIGINEELISYLNSKNVNHNLDSKLVNIDHQVENIVKNIINDEMDDREKMDAIANYVINNVEYDSSDAEKYNSLALSSALSGKGVCANYAALTNAMCAKAGVSSYFAYNDTHAWNLVNIEGQYYYVDTTNICQIPGLSKLIMEKFGKGIYYMQDPYHTALSAMTDVDEIDVPKTLLKLIDEAQDKKSFIEKYGSNFYVDFFIILGVSIGLGVFIKIAKEKIFG